MAIKKTSVSKALSLYLSSTQHSAFSTPSTPTSISSAFTASMFSKLFLLTVACSALSGSLAHAAPLEQRADEIAPYCVPFTTLGKYDSYVAYDISEGMPSLGTSTLVIYHLSRSLTSTLFSRLSTQLRLRQLLHLDPHLHQPRPARQLRLGRLEESHRSAVRQGRPV
jgi:hypothetical protein